MRWVLLAALTIILTSCMEVNVACHEGQNEDDKDAVYDPSLIDAGSRVDGVCD